MGKTLNTTAGIHPNGGLVPKAERMVLAPPWGKWSYPNLQGVPNPRRRPIDSSIVNWTTPAHPIAVVVRHSSLIKLVHDTGDTTVCGLVLLSFLHFDRGVGGSWSAGR